MKNRTTSQSQDSDPILKAKTKTSESDAPYLDEDEQRQVVDELMADHDSFARSCKKMLQFVSLLCCGCLIFCVFNTWSHPWEMSHQQRFEGIVSCWIFQATYATQIYNSWSALQILEGRWSVWVYGMLSSSVLLCYWSWFFYNNSMMTTVQFYWLPFGGIVLHLASLYIQRQMNSVNVDLAKLESMMYKYKSV